MPNEHVKAKRIKSAAFAGRGCVFQGLGFLALGLGFLGGVPDVIAGAVVALIFFIAGSVMSMVWKCSNCRNKLEDRKVRICPTCKAEFSV